MECADCGKYTYTIYGDTPLCPECRTARENERVCKKAEAITKPSDFAPWGGRDLSELFWIHLARYIKEPNPESFKLVYQAVMWARHADGGLASSFSHALSWAKIDLWAEEERWRAKEKGDTE